MIELSFIWIFLKIIIVNIERKCNPPFGDSKSQITLHTSVLYYYDNVLDIMSVNPIFTFSKNIRHDPVLICAHLLPILDIIKSNVPNLKIMHFTSDGPVTQYRNKSMFYLPHYSFYYC